MVSSIYKKTFSVLMKRPFRLWGISLLAEFLCLVAYAGFIGVPAAAFCAALLLSASMSMIFLNSYRTGLEPKTAYLFASFKKDRILRVLGGMAWMQLWIFLWSLIPIVGIVFGIIRMYEYRFVPYILMTRDDVKPTDALRVSREQTMGYKGKMFWADVIPVLLWIAVLLLCLLEPGCLAMDAADAAAETVPPGAGGLIYLPYLEGERSPVFDAQAQGVFFGMNTTHKREHFLRAVLEGVAFSLSQITGVLRERQTIDRMQIIGGGAHSKLWKQIIADVCDVTLQDVSIFSDNATSLGAAAAAGVGIGLYRDLEEAAEKIKDGACLAPDPATQPAYENPKARYAALYPALKDIMHMPK